MKHRHPPLTLVNTWIHPPLTLDVTKFHFSSNWMHFRWDFVKHGLTISIIYVLELVAQPCNVQIDDSLTKTSLPCIFLFTYVKSGAFW